MAHLEPDREGRGYSWFNVFVGALLVVMAIFSVVTYVVESNTREDSDKAQQQCLEDQFFDLSKALEARASTTEKESAAVRRIWDTFAEAAGLVKDDPTQELSPEDQDRLNTQLVDALLDYKDVQNEIKDERDKNPIPPYPVGKCDQEK